MITPLSNVFFCGFLKLNSSRHPMVMTLRPVAADGIGTVPIPSAATGLSVITGQSCMDSNVDRPRRLRAAKL